MPVTPDKNDVIISLLQDLKLSLDKLVNGTPASTGTGGGTAVETEAEKFLERWGPLDPAKFVARYGKNPVVADNGVLVKLPPMSSYDEEEVRFRARFGFDPRGNSTSGVSRMAEAVSAVKVIANATQDTAKTLYETGFGLCDPDLAAYGFLTGTWVYPKDVATDFGYGFTPRKVAGLTLDQFLANDFGPQGTPSGGG